MYPVEPTTRMFISLGLLFLKVEEEEEDDVAVSRDETGLSLRFFEGSLVWKVEARGNEYEFSC